jgi:hypothetical protein
MMTKGSKNIGKYAPPPRGGGLSTDVIRGKNMKMEEKKGENVREKIDRGKKMRKLEVKG